MRCRQMLFFKRVMLLWVAFCALAQVAQGSSLPPQKEEVLVSSFSLPQDGRLVQTVRVLLQKTTEVFLSTDPVTTVYDRKTGVFLAAISQKKFLARVVNNNIELEGKRFAQTDLLLKSAGSFSFDKGRFSGDLILVRINNAEMLVINECDLEEYVRGVLPSEVFSSWPLEALKTQAVAARTYGVFSILKNNDRLYHVVDTVASQVYGGLNRQTPETNRAVIETRAKILSYQGRVFPAFFHATCGGHTTPASLVWSIEEHPCLTRVFCSYCRQSPHYSWERRFLKVNIEQALRKKQLIGGTLQAVLPGESDAYGRLLEVILRTEDGVSRRMRAHEFRLLLGSELMRSTFCQIFPQGDEILMRGNGWGHGVGLCQWGMKVMAEQGFSADEILTFYFPLSERKLLTSLRAQSA